MALAAHEAEFGQAGQEDGGADRPGACGRTQQRRIASEVAGLVDRGADAPLRSTYMAVERGEITVFKLSITTGSVTPLSRMRSALRIPTN